MADDIFEIVEKRNEAVIKVVGIGGGGGNAVRHMLASNIEGVEFVVANTDAQALKDLSNCATIQLGGNVTRGLGAGANPEVGRLAAEEDREHIAEALSGADMVFITAGMGGGTGTGAAPIFAEIAREQGALTVAIVTRPFKFEGGKRSQVAEHGLGDLEANVDSLITIPNEKLLSVLGKDINLLKAFSAANDVLLGAVQGISDLIVKTGTINLDFSDVKTIMSEMGMAMMGTGSATGENRAREATEAAIRSPLLEDINLDGAQGILVNITVGKEVVLGEFTEVGEIIDSFAAESATVVVGTVIDESLGDEFKVTVVATGLSNSAGRIVKAVDNTKTVDAGYNNYHKLDVPPAMRRKVAMSQGNAALDSNNAQQSDESMYLDIPAFLRRQAD